jgi:hypothetical protein
MPSMLTSSTDFQNSQPVLILNIIMMLPGSTLFNCKLPSGTGVGVIYIESTAGTLLWFSVWPTSLVLAPRTAGVQCSIQLLIKNTKQWSGCSCSATWLHKLKPFQGLCECSTDKLKCECERCGSLPSEMHLHDLGPLSALARNFVSFNGERGQQNHVSYRETMRLH